MPSLRLYFLGQPKIEHNGIPAKVPLQKALALLAYLALNNERFTRNYLATFLWPENSPEASLNNLRVTLHSLRKTFGDEWFFIDRNSVGIARKAHLWVDVSQFSELVASLQSHYHSSTAICADCIPTLAEAIQLYRGNFLEGFTLKDSDLFDEWQRFQQTTLLQMALDVLKKLVNGYIAQGDYPQAILYAQQWLSLDPINETIHQTLMKLYSWTHQYHAAIKQYQECTQILEKELGEAPQHTTTQIYQAIKEHRLPPPLAHVNLIDLNPRPISQPASASPFLGRERELAEITERLKEPACRLLTLIGPSGIGKTRLALQAARENASFFPNGVWYIPLVAVPSPEGLATTMVESLGISLEGQRDIHSQLFNYLKNRKALLILDNFEHLIEGVSLIEDLLKRAPSIKMMVTSCERLNLQLEWLYHVQGLEYPSHEDEPIEEYSAIQLFLHSAKRVNPSFSLQKADRPYVVQICRFLDGMPLGIELAASWTHLLSCQEIVREIEQDLDFLTVSTRDIPSRHRSLRAVFESSWKLLSEEERKTIKSLSVFRGGFQRHAAEQIAGANLGLLSSLTNKSFLHRSPTGRYEILETSRKFIEERLQEKPVEYLDTMDRHARYYGRYLKEREAQLKGGSQFEALQEISAEIENIRLAWHWMVNREQVLEIDQAQECLHLFYNMRSWLHEGVKIFSEAVAKLRELTEREKIPAQQNRVTLARLLARQGYFYDRIGNYEKAREVLQESLSILRELNLTTEMAIPLRGLARLSLDLENYSEARELYQTCLKICEENNDTWGTVRCLDSLGFIALYFDEDAKARKYLERGVTLAKQNGDHWGTTWCLMDLGFIALLEQSYSEAEQLLQECLTTTKLIGDWQGIATTLSYLALLAVGKGNYEEARQIYQHEISSWQELGYQVGLAYAHMHFGFFLFMIEEYPEAKSNLLEALELALSISSAPTIERSLVGIVSLLVKEKNRQEATELIERTIYHPAIFGKIRDIRPHLFSSADMSLKFYARYSPKLYNEFLEGIHEINKIAQSVVKPQTP
ncbi:MAG: Transcriptional regulator, LuxR family [Anaerolineae bacterium]|jgi:predicted ATPase/DNA-binding SARP family transcriptional activator|nr:MAG: Transcriptional regulator, LuxR family [Anaerolineae bacterium]